MSFGRSKVPCTACVALRLLICLLFVLGCRVGRCDAPQRAPVLYPDTWIREYRDERRFSAPFTLTDSNGQTIKTSTGAEEIFVISNYLPVEVWFKRDPTEVEFEGFFDGQLIKGVHSPDGSEKKYQDLSFAVTTGDHHVLNMHPLQALPSHTAQGTEDVTEFRLPGNNALRIVREHKLRVLPQLVQGFFMPECERWSDRLEFLTPEKLVAWSRVVVVMPAYWSAKYCRPGGTMHDGDKLVNPDYEFDDQVTGPVYLLADGSVLVRFLQHFVRMNLSPAGLASGARQLQQYESERILHVKDDFLAKKIAEYKSNNERFDNCRRAALASKDQKAMAACGETFFNSNTSYWSLPLVQQLLKIEPVDSDRIQGR